MTTYMNEPFVCPLVYEELVQDPSYFTQRVCSFLKIASEPILHSPTIFGIPTRVKTSSEDVKHVFHSKKQWYHDLRVTDIIFIYLFNLRYKKLNYSRLANHLKNRSKSP